jgi:pentose-5-phosphate-3-epimerase
MVLIKMSTTCKLHAINTIHMKAFQSSIIDKIKALREWMSAKGLEIELMIDGGVTNNTAKDCVDAGASVLVAGTFLFSHPVSLKQGIQDLLPSEEK